MLFLFTYLVVFLLHFVASTDIPLPFQFGEFERRYRPLSKSEINEARQQVLELFYFGYDNYMKYAFPHDELDPIHCTGRGHDHANPQNININDVLGDYSLTLVDTLNNLAIFNNKTEFHKAVRLVIDTVHFDKNVTVQIFEATIRVVGSLLSNHLILTNENSIFGDFRMKDYNNELLEMAHDLVTRLIVGFDTNTGIPYPRVNLKKGVMPKTINETCLSGAGSLLLEFGVLSRLVNDDVFERLARKAVQKLWSSRHKQTNLLGNVIDIQTGQWTGHMAGIGAGLDSFYEYLLKSYIMFSDERDLDMFVQAYETVHEKLRRGRPHCRYSTGDPPFYLNSDFRDASIANSWIDSLAASFPGVQVLAGELSEAICLHAFYFAIWAKFDMLPERYNWKTKASDVHFYPLRPEFIESTYLLYQASKSPFYQHVGLQVLESINQHTRVKCGFATIHNVNDKSHEDRMESFMLAETLKYLYLLFDEDNPVNKNQERLLFSTEGHLFPILKRFHEPIQDIYGEKLSTNSNNELPLIFGYNETCEQPLPNDRLGSPIGEFHLNQYFNAVGLSSC
ncbi:Alpha-1,2-Mannosidase [Aphelenchoides bicaudatus]|nr:Alpha-1,2-Mannosidase [Aphelenchoides bicaudatus]